MAGNERSTKSDRKHSRELIHIRRRRIFRYASVLLALALTIVIGLPIAETVTRRVVRDEHRQAVLRYNSANASFLPVYTYKGYVADAEHSIEYRLLPSHSRSISNVTGQWRRLKNEHRYVAGTWNLLNEQTFEPAGYLTWLPQSESTTPTMIPMFRRDPLEMARIITSDRQASDKIITPRPIRSETIATESGFRWHYLVGDSGSLVEGDNWHFVPVRRDIPTAQWRWNYRIDAHGFRRRTTPVSGGNGRLVFLGDSFLFGWGVHDHETVTEQLEQQLKRQSQAAFPHCLNLGVPGYNIEQASLTLVENLDRVEPTAVVLCCTANDLEPQTVAPHLPRRLYRHALFRSWFLERSKPALNSMLPASLHFESNLHIAANDTETSWTEAAHKIHAGRRSLLSIRDLCKEHELPLLVVSMPSLLGEKSHTTVLKNWCSDFDIPFLDLLPAIAGHDLNSLKVSELDSHPNALCHALFAKSLEAPIADLLPPDGSR